MRLTVVLLLAALHASSAAFADTGFLDRSVVVGGTTYRFSVYIPPDFTTATRWPVILDLHGNGAQGSDGIRQTAHFLADRIRMARTKFPLIAIFPQAARGETWQSTTMQSMVIAELDAVIAEFHGDPDRVYLGGFSMGASGTYAIAARFADRFAAAYAIDGLSSIAADRLAPRLRHLPIRIFQGAADERVPAGEVRALVAALEKAAVPLEYIEYADTRHGPAAEKAYAEEDFVTWLLAHRRQP